MIAHEPKAGLQAVWQQTWELAVELKQDWSRHRIGGLSAEIAFFAILGLFPAVIVFAAALGWLDDVIGQDSATSIETWLLDRITEVFGTENTLRTTASDLFDRSSAGLITVGILISVYASSRGFIAVVRALDVAYGTEQRHSWLATRLVGFALTVLTLIVASVVAVMVVVGPLLGTSDELAEHIGAGSVVAAAWSWLRWPVVIVVLIGWASSVYRFVPRHRVPWRGELPGAVVGTVWWLVVSLGFRTYIDLASNGINAVFGILGGALTLLLWLYLLAMGLLAGAVLNSVLARRRATCRSA